MLNSLLLFNSVHDAFFTLTWPLAFHQRRRYPCENFVSKFCDPGTTKSNLKDAIHHSQMPFELNFTGFMWSVKSRERKPNSLLKHCESTNKQISSYKC